MITRIYTAPTCPICGEELEGDGYSTVMYCPHAKGKQLKIIEEAEPDAGPIYCTGERV